MKHIRVKHAYLCRMTKQHSVEISGSQNPITLNPIVMRATETRYKTKSIHADIIPLFGYVIFVLFRLLSLAIYIINVNF